MASSYAIRQPQGFKNHVENIAIIGAGGRVGTWITKSLLSHGKHNVTAITRPDSKSELPSGLHSIKKTDYSHASLVEVMKDQEVLIITLGRGASPDSQKQLIDAAAEAGVRYIMSNEYGGDYDDESLAKDTIIGEHAVAIRRYIEKVGKGRLHWIALSSSFWYEFCLARSELRFGFDLEEKSITLFDDGNEKISVTTWKQSGEAAAKLFALKIVPEDVGDENLTLSQFEDKAVFVSSFTVSQRDV